MQLFKLVRTELTKGYVLSRNILINLKRLRAFHMIITTDTNQYELCITTPWGYNPEVAKLEPIQL